MVIAFQAPRRGWAVGRASSSEWLDAANTLLIARFGLTPTGFLRLIPWFCKATCSLGRSVFPSNYTIGILLLGAVQECLEWIFGDLRIWWMIINFVQCLPAKAENLRCPAFDFLISLLSQRPALDVLLELYFFSSHTRYLVKPYESCW